MTASSGDITIQLLNQEEDKDHVEKVIDFTDDTPDGVGNRVINGKRNENGRGIAEFLPNSNLERGYLKNDCLKFCITKVALP